MRELLLFLGMLRSLIPHQLVILFTPKVKKSNQLISKFRRSQPVLLRPRVNHSLLPEIAFSFSSLSSLE